MFITRNTNLSDLIKQLLAERFLLTFHKENKELSAYAITVAKNGSKLCSLRFSNSSGCN